MKTYVLIVSEKFPKTHKRSGEETHFIQQIIDGVKKHTIRGNYDLWKKRIDEIQEGKAYLSVRIWTGKPYCSKQKEMLQLTEVGIQRFCDGKFCHIIDYKEVEISEIELANNDGLSLEDFDEWFKGATNPMAIIHFTDFRYPA